jgi:hypothetical protein
VVVATAAVVDTSRSLTVTVPIVLPAAAAKAVVALTASVTVANQFTSWLRRRRRPTASFKFLGKTVLHS